MPKVRCAIYTRKSTEEGLDQEFNSLDAQREACEAYIASQRHEGWVLLRDHYDDGGISGGHLDRPALQRLMEDVDENRVDQIVVYKIDRLTRSLADFAKLVDRLDAAGASFVSFTQSFNTATSMGRLTLNVLLSFAQFEREVTAERIRDKIAASKKKGLWMGGYVPLGYDADGRTLAINQTEATTIIALFNLYDEHHALNVVTSIATEQGLRSKRYTTGSGRRTGGNQMTRGHIHKILTNPLYAGRIAHKGEVYDGQHPAIIDADRWERVQQMLQGQASRPRKRLNGVCDISLLMGKLFDVSGERLTPSHSKKGKRRYRYYISQSLREQRVADITTPTWRLSAKPLEAQIETEILSHLKRALPRGLIQNVDGNAIAMRLMDLEAGEFSPLDYLAKVSLAPGKLTIELDVRQIAAWAGVNTDKLNTEYLEFETTFTLRRRGVETKLLFEGDKPQRDETLLKNIARGHRLLQEIKRGKSFREIAIAEGLSNKRVHQILEFAFFSPAAVQMVLDAKQPNFLTTDWVLKNEIPGNWLDQAQLFAIG
ncbi:recombinase family protein [Roseovarius phycicola]|uniref:Recombinase family protein n=1 Tax=Roseovarius phycicola TaxID=3080976 RepID=A0ABZ2HDF3_9RHOB